ncbi:hypothetical protein [Streptomyces buecherae]|uniref:Uncharacterized protein n=1 Tax=Streptomyces buecherae TaxID=2763006 RepID=A0A7H8N2R4_9ACTN|nr:hypothetical protein [Streptomyces buecherae]QKW48298.1 hypothetical protein HUT08_00685 [Streptomyces buecherae]
MNRCASAQAEPRARIPGKKKGRDKVRSCARHGKLDTSGTKDKITLRNRCKYSFTYHLEIERGPDRCVTVKKNKSKKTDWRWPGKLKKVTNGGANGKR